MSNAPLLLCPFCGHQAFRASGGEGENKYFGTRCSVHACPGANFGLFHRSQDAADKAWNRRSVSQGTVPAIDYDALIEAAKVSNKTWTPGKTGCIAFARGAAWFRLQLLGASSPQTS
jgi:hypothetical protein